MKKVTIDLKKGATLRQLMQFEAQRGKHTVKAIFKDTTTFNGRKYYIDNISDDGAVARLIDVRRGTRRIGILKKFKIVKVV